MKQQTDRNQARTFKDKATPRNAENTSTSKKRFTDHHFEPADNT
jgi:hypothetical protein